MLGVTPITLLGHVRTDWLSVGAVIPEWPQSRAITHLILTKLKLYDQVSGALRRLEWQIRNNKEETERSK